MQPADADEAGDDENWNLLVKASQNPPRHNPFTQVKHTTISPIGHQLGHQASAPPDYAEASYGRAMIIFPPGSRLIKNQKFLAE